VDDYQKGSGQAGQIGGDIGKSLYSSGGGADSDDVRQWRDLELLSSWIPVQK